MGAVKYDAFISYSHAVDGRLGPALRDALHRFAKPWHRLRGLRVFCDRRSLSVNSGLWSTIQAAIAESRCFLLLASPESANSPWVQREIDCWVHTEPKRPLLIGLTGGEIAWDQAAGDFDWARTTALPVSLRGWFTEEPLWVDLTTANEADDLSLNNPVFLDAVATLAAQLHDRPKDELVGEDVRQHRRATRFRRFSFAGLSVLTVFALVAALLADVQRRHAEVETRRAVARMLATQSSLDTGRAFDRAVLLALEAYRLDPSEDTMSSLVTVLDAQPAVVTYLHASRGDGQEVLQTWLSKDFVTAVQRNGVLTRWRVADHQSTTSQLISTEIHTAALRADGATVAALTERGELLFTRVGTLEAARKSAHSCPRGTTPGLSSTAFRPWRNQLAFSTDGSLIAACEVPGREGAAHVLVLDPVTDQIRRQLTLDLGISGVDDIALSPGGDLLAVGGPFRFGVWDLTSGEPLPGPDLEVTGYHDRAGQGFEVSFVPDGGQVVAAGEHGVIAWDVQQRRAAWSSSRDYRLAKGLALSANEVITVPSQDGRLLRWNRQSGQQLAPVEAPFERITSLAAARDGHVLAIGTVSDAVVLLDPERTSRLARLVDRPWRSSTHSPPRGIGLQRDGRTLAIGHPGQDVVLVNLENFERTVIIEAPGAENVALSADGRRLAVLGGRPVVGVFDLAAQRVDEVVLATGESLAISPDGTKVAYSSGVDNSVVEIVDFGSDVHEFFETRGVTKLEFSRDARLLAVSDRSGQVRLWDVTARPPRAVPFPGGFGNISALAFDPTANVAAIAQSSEHGGVIRVDLDSGNQTFRHLDVSSGGVSALEFSPDGWLLAAATRFGHAVGLWYATTSGRPLISALRLPHAEIADLAVATGPVLATLGTDGAVAVWDLSVESLHGVACAVVHRDLAPDERSRYLSADMVGNALC